MAKTTGIAWCDSTFNPVIGCTKVSPGCDNCYAAEQDARKRWDGGKTHWGAGVPRYRTSKSNWAQPRAWDRTAGASGKPWRVFCGSLCDVFDNEWPDGARDDLYELIRETESLKWLLVTKRIGNVAKMVPSSWNQYRFPSNVRILITVCNQEEADRDIPKLLALPCKNGISYEPALGPIDFSHDSEVGPLSFLREYDQFGEPRMRRVEWVIVGGESGPKARPFDLAWARSTVAQCKAAGVPVFVKQLGRNPHDYTRHDFAKGVASNYYNVRWQLVDRAGANYEEWPEDLCVREFPE